MDASCFYLPFLSFPPVLAVIPTLVPFTPLFLQISIPPVSLFPNSKLFHCEAGQPTGLDVNSYCPYYRNSLLTFMPQWDLSIEMSKKKKKINLLSNSEVGFLYCGCLYSPHLSAGDGDTLLSAPDCALTGDAGALKGCAVVLWGSCVPSVTSALQKLLYDFCQTQNGRVPNYDISWDELKTAFFLFTILPDNSVSNPL